MEYNIDFYMLLIVISIIYLIGVFIYGCTKVRYREAVCTKTITANIISIKTYHWFLCKYYKLNCEFIYKDKTYNVSKALFKKIELD